MNVKPAVRARRIRFSYPTGSLERHFVRGDLLMSHIVAHLSATFPEGEDFFIRSVRHFADQVTDPELKSQIQGFIGQEVTHGREHRALNERLHQMGYPSRRIDRGTRMDLAAFERRLSPLTCLAITAALEHFTAVLAETLLTDERAQELLGPSEVRAMLLWHAIEESEHRSVAFDVYRAIGGSERKRVWSMKVMRWTIPIMAVQLLVQVWMSDKAARKPGAMRASLKRFLKNPLFSKDMWEAIKDFERPGFHPDQRNTDAMLAEWSERLFGSEGELNDKLLASAAV